MSLSCQRSTRHAATAANTSKPPYRALSPLIVKEEHVFVVYPTAIVDGLEVSQLGARVNLIVHADIKQCQTAGVAGNGELLQAWYGPANNSRSIHVRGSLGVRKVTMLIKQNLATEPPASTHMHI